MLTPASPTTYVDNGIAPTCLGSDGNLLDLGRAIAGPNGTEANGYYLTAESAGDPGRLRRPRQGELDRLRHQR